MHFITLVVVPGPGASTLEVSEEYTLAQLAADHSLNGRQLVLNGELVSPDNWSTTAASGEIFATGTVKGN